MSEAVSVTLGGMGRFARELVATERYASMSEVVRAGLRALQREEAELEALMKAKVAEALADDRPGIPLEEAFARLRAEPTSRRA